MIFVHHRSGTPSLLFNYPRQLDSPKEQEWDELIQHSLRNYKSEIFNEETLVQVSSVKKIYKEIRFWVVDGKVITGSQYRLGNQTIYDEYYEDEAKEFAQSMVDKFQLAKAFVIDVCLVDSGWKIMECGCINSFLCSAISTGKLAS